MLKIINTIIILFTVIYLLNSIIISSSIDYSFDSHDYEYVNENHYYDLYRKLYRESIYSQIPNMTIIISLLIKAFEGEDKKINICIDIIRLYSIAYRRTLKNQVCGDISESPSQIYTYYKYTNNLKLIKANICEIGFLFGVSSLTFFLATGLSSKYYGFDYGHPQSKYIFSLLENYFDMHMMWGKSQETVPLFNKTVKCDIIHIDGSHIPELIYKDIENMKRFSFSKSILIIDDITSKNFAWKESLENNMINEIYCSKYKSFCIGKYI